MTPVLLDTGPLVAFLNRQDRFHAWAKEALARIEPPLLTCEAVLSEACFLVRRLSGGPRAVIELVGRGLLRVPFRLEKEAAQVQRLVSRYADVPMSLADACLVRMAELHERSAIVTLDDGFFIYRKKGRQVLALVHPRHG